MIGRSVTPRPKDESEDQRKTCSCPGPGRGPAQGHDQPRGRPQPQGRPAWWPTEIGEHRVLIAGAVVRVRAALTFATLATSVAGPVQYAS